MRRDLRRDIRRAVGMLLAGALSGLAAGATLHVGNQGIDAKRCGSTTATACRSISRAIALAQPGDTISVGPGRYGDLNRNGSTSEPGEEFGSPGCGCLLSINKPVNVVSTHGAAVTTIDARSVDLPTNVLINATGGEFGRPAQGFMVTETKRRASLTTHVLSGNALVIDAVSVQVRGNQLLYNSTAQTIGKGITVINDQPIHIEGNLVARWDVGIATRGAVVITRNQILANQIGITALGGRVTANAVHGNRTGIQVVRATEVRRNDIQNNGIGILVGTFAAGTVARSNNIQGNGGASTRFRCGLSNFVPSFDASGNYWGDRNGPAGVNADQVCELPAVATPFATRPFVVRIAKP